MENAKAEYRPCVFLLNLPQLIQVKLHFHTILRPQLA
jgi:hypothetical protein